MFQTQTKMIPNFVGTWMVDFFRNGFWRLWYRFCVY